MSKTLTKDEVKKIGDEILNSPRPEKAKYRRVEAIREWKDAIQKRRDEGLSFEEIAKIVTQASGSTFRAKEIEKTITEMQTHRSRSHQKKQVADNERQNNQS